MITLIMGNMFAGKTTELVRRLERAYLAKKKVILLRPEKDSRPFLSHADKNNNITWLKQEFVDDLLKFDFSKYDCLGIDEGQFHLNLSTFCKLVRRNNKNVFVSALQASSEAEMFDPIIELIPHCEEIIKLNSICTQCGDDNATYTYFLAGNKKSKIFVGGGDQYTALCAKCYEENRTKDIQKEINDGKKENIYDVNEHLTSKIDL